MREPLIKPDWPDEIATSTGNTVLGGAEVIAAIMTAAIFITNIVLDDQNRPPAALFSAKSRIEIGEIYLATAWKIG